MECKHRLKSKGKLFTIIRCIIVLVLITINTMALAQQEEEYGTGLLFDSINTRSIPQHAALTKDSYRGLPSSVSYEQYCPQAGNQGKFGTCVGFATAYSLRTTLYVKAMREAGYTANPNDHLFSPSFIYEQIKFADDKDCSKGSYVSDALELLQYIGVATLKTMPYQCGTTISEASLTESANYKIVSYQQLFSIKDTDADFRVLMMKKALSEGNPCLFSFKTTKSFKTSRGTDLWKQQKDDQEPGDIKMGHAMCLVGYDDNKYGGSFRVLNSWGTGWGDKGFIWIPYRDLAKYTYQCFQVQGEKIKPPKVDPLIVKPEIKGTIRFQQNTGESMNASLLSFSLAEGLPTYRMNANYTSGTRFRFYMNTSTDAYIYAFASDFSGKINQIFPYDAHISPLLGKNSTVAFPSETKVIRMDESKGTDYLLILYSKKPLTQSSILQQLQQAQGGFVSKVKTSLKNNFISSHLINYVKDQIAFELKADSNADILPILIEIPHY